MNPVVVSQLFTGNRSASLGAGAAMATAAGGRLVVTFEPSGKPKTSKSMAAKGTVIEEMRLAIAKKLDIDPDRLRYGPLDDGLQGRLGTGGDHWQIHYRDQWRELPWHFDGPLWVTRELVRKWWG